MKNVKYILLLTLCACLSLFIGAMVGCTKQVNLTLLDWEDYVDSVSYGEEYQLENCAVDQNGNVYSITATVKDSNKKQVDVKYFKFIVSDYDGYEIKYSFSHKGTTYSKTVQLNVTASAPMIEIAPAELFFPGGNYDLPIAIVTDYVDMQISDYTVEIYKKTDNGDQKVENAIADGKFTISELGDYYFLYSAVNSNNVTGYKTLEFSMESIDDYMPYVVKVNEENASKIYYEGRSDRSKFVDSTADELKSIKGDYVGNAVKFTADYGYEGQFKVKNIYPKETLDLIAESYNSVSLWYAYDLYELAGQEGNGNLLFMENNGTPQNGEQIVYDCFFKRANAIDTASITDEKIWEKLTITIEDYIALVEENDYEYFTLFGLANRNDVIDPQKSGIYISDVLFENVVETVATVTKATASVINLDNYAGHSTYLHKSRDELSKISGDYSGSAIKMLVTNAYRDRYRVNNFYTLEQLNQIKQKFNTVSMWIAYDLVPESGTTCSVRHLVSNTYESEPLNANFFEKAGLIVTVNQTDKPTWKKVSISIEDYITLLSVTEYQYCVLFGLVATNIDTENSAIYLGDIFFENIAK